MVDEAAADGSGHGKMATRRQCPRSSPARGVAEGPGSVVPLRSDDVKVSDRAAILLHALVLEHLVHRQRIRCHQQLRTCVHMYSNEGW